MEGYLGMIMMWPMNWAPKYWRICDGSLMSISENPALYSLLGITFGGDGRTTFGLPDLRGRVAVGAGYGPGLSSYMLGWYGGYERIPLMQNQMPNHEHSLNTQCEVTVEIPASSDSANKNQPDKTSVVSASSYNGRPVNSYSSSGADTTLKGFGAGGKVLGSTEEVGGGQAHENRQPYSVLNYIICVDGIFPQRP